MKRSRLGESRLGLDKLYVIRYDLREILSGNSCPYTPDGIDIIFLIFCKETLLYFNFDIAKLCEERLHSTLLTRYGDTNKKNVKQGEIRN